MDRKSKTDYLDIAQHVAQRVVPYQNAKLRALEFLRNCLGDGGAGQNSLTDVDRPSRRDAAPPSRTESPTDSTR